MKSVTSSRFDMIASGNSWENSRMPPAPKRGYVGRAINLVSGAVTRVLQVLGAKNALVVDRLDLGSPECMGAEAWVRDVKAEEERRSTVPGPLEIQRVREAEALIERRIARRRGAALVLVLAMFIGLIALASYASFSAPSTSTSSIGSAPGA